jgi:hypothetical protein
LPQTNYTTVLHAFRLNVRAVLRAVTNCPNHQGKTTFPNRKNLPYNQGQTSFLHLQRTGLKGSGWGLLSGAVIWEKWSAAKVGRRRF